MRVDPSNKKTFSLIFPAFRISCKAFFLLYLLLQVLLPPSVHADEQIIVTVLLNSQPRGDIFAVLRVDGDFLVKDAALQDMGLKQVKGTQVEFNAEPYLSLRSVEGLSYLFNDKSLTIEIEADPTLLPTNTLDLSPVRNSGVLYPKDNSLFLNYGLSYHTRGDSFAFSDLNLASELGVRIKDTLFLTNSLFTELPDQSRFVRLNTSFIRDDRQTMRRIIGGDFPASSGELGSQLNMGGVSLSKVYRIDPYLIRSPLFNFSGLLTRPSEVDVYVNGLRVRTERFSPGEFELRNLQAISGGQNIEIVVRDPFGREQRYFSPFYFSDNILREGLHEYSYNIGALRENFGLASNDYAHLVFSAFHRYGVSDSFNAGVQAEGGKGLVNAGVQSSVKLSTYGLLRAEAAASFRQNDTGYAGRVGYEYQSSTLQGSLSIQTFSDGYRTLADTTDTIQRRKFNLFAGFGYTLPFLGSLAVQYLKMDLFNGTGNSDLNLSWTRQLWKQVFFNASYRHILEPQTGNEASVAITWSFAPGYSALASLQGIKEADAQVISVRKDPPVGEGTGWSVRAERTRNNASEGFTFNPTLQYNAQRGILRGDYTMTESSGTSNQDLLLSLSGSLLHLGNTFAFARPVSDSFAVVKVGDVEGIRIHANGQTLGRSDSQGKVVVPELTSFYENQLTMEDKDVPVDYLMQKVRLLVSPPFRSGSCLTFPLQKYLSFTGNISLASGEKSEPLSNAELTLTAPDGKVTFWTGDKGEFYFDNGQAEMDVRSVQGCANLSEAATSFLSPGVYPITVHRENQIFTAQLTIPKVEGPEVELGAVVIPAPLPLSVLKPELSSEPPERERPLKDSVPAKTESPGTAGTTMQQAVSAPLAAPEERPLSGAPSPPESEFAPKAATVPLHNISETGQVPAKPAPAAEPVPPPSGSPGEPRVFEVYFRFGTTDFASGDDRAALYAVSRYLRSTGSSVIIEGHTDQIGSQRYNLRLGMKRGLTVAEMLKQPGAEGKKIKDIKSYGKRQPKCQSLDEKCRAINRRVVLTVIPD